MTRLYADEDVPAALVRDLRAAGHDILTAFEAQMANQGIADELQLAFAVARQRAFLTMNRRDCARLHRKQPDHAGIVACTRTLTPDVAGKAVAAALARLPDLARRYVRVQADRTLVDGPRDSTP